MKRFQALARMAALPLVFLLPLGAQVTTTPDPGITRQQADEILRELRQIRQLLESAGKQPQAQKEQEVKAKLSLSDAPMLGSKDAPITMVEFTDFQCPFCQRFHVSVFSELKKNYIDTGKVRFFSRDMPLDFHPNAMRAALAGRCAGEQGKFWQMRDTMAANPDKLDINNLVAFATDLKLDVKTFRGCVDSERHKEAVQRDIMEAMKVGADGTPSFVVGKSTPDGVDGVLVVGALPYPAFEQKLAEAAKK